METTRLTNRELFAAVARAPGVSADLCSQLYEALRIAWAAQVLDAVGESYPGAGWRMTDLGEDMTPTCTVYPTVRTEDALHYTSSWPDAARLVAAIEEFPKLKPEVRARLGECP